MFFNWKIILQGIYLGGFSRSYETGPFYENGLRARKVLTDYIKPDYRGAIQCDGFSDYKTLETKEYPHVIHLACFQHCKRKFLDIQANKDAQRVIEIINRLYRKEHEIPLEYTFGQILEYRKE
ncbi:IS66 family transposase [Bacteroides thetaiotaomicron]|uniref:IS66 family transposase n=1 Tax=Bacteroides thetaiotaomicron TaxID=818 RepID=UPI001E551491|nr:IS66 family transposase [Bacteroides thetaiotaomicron]MCS2245558.1 IS66 family transposase [Bacteroides thetaiotaomicron]MDC2160221.1 transposase [Bacteroides thetaiotaomicron]UVP55544.1 IS66 family transposase [Bacteroides thetaiotaomicron]